MLFTICLEIIMALKKRLDQNLSIFAACRLSFLLIRIFLSRTFISPWFLHHFIVVWVGISWVFSLDDFLAWMSIYTFSLADFLVFKAVLHVEIDKIFSWNCLMYIFYTARGILYEPHISVIRSCLITCSVVLIFYVEGNCWHRNGIKQNFNSSMLWWFFRFRKNIKMWLIVCLYLSYDDFMEIKLFDLKKLESFYNFGTSKLVESTYDKYVYCDVYVLYGFVLLLYQYGVHFNQMRKFLLNMIVLVRKLVEYCLKQSIMLFHYMDLLLLNIAQVDLNEYSFHMICFSLFSIFYVWIFACLMLVSGKMHRTGSVSRKEYFEQIQKVIILVVLWIQLRLMLAGDVESNPGPCLNSIRFPSAYMQDFMGKKKLPFIKTNSYIKDFDSLASRSVIAFIVIQFLEYFTDFLLLECCRLRVLLLCYDALIVFLANSVKFCSGMLMFLSCSTISCARGRRLRLFYNARLEICAYNVLYLSVILILAGDIELNPGPSWNGIHFLSANVQDIMGRKKLPVIKSDWYTKDFDLYMFCETWLKPEITNSEFQKQGFNVFRKDRSEMQHGGVLVMTRPNFNFKEVHFSTISSEILVIECDSLVVVSFYRPEWCKNSFINDLRKVLVWHAKERASSRLLIVGDGNMKDVKDWDIGFVLPSQASTTFCRDFVSLLQDFSLYQKVSTPTRGNNILDLAITNFPDCMDVEVEPGVSDHHSVVGRYRLQLEKRSVSTRKVLCWSKTNWEEVRELVKERFSNFDRYLEIHSVDGGWNFFRGVLMEILTKIPFKYVGNKKDAPFVTSFMKRCIRRRKRKFKKAKLTGLSADWTAYEEQNKFTKQVVRRGKENFYNKLLNVSFDNKKFFALVNRNKVDKVNIPDLNYNGQLVRSPFEKAKVFNSFFGSVFQKEDINFVPSKGVSTFPEAPEFTFEVSGVRHLLLNLKSSKAAGSDDLPSMLLKTLADDLAVPMTLFFRKCYFIGTCPQGWKNAFVCPVFKNKGCRSDPSSYRPVSLTPICSKIFEHIMVSNLMRFVESQNILKEEQHGFRKGRSCELQLSMFVDDLHKSYNSNFQTDAVFLDMAKAFDKVPHARLAEKLHFYGIRGKNLVWIKDFLKYRSQQVVVEGIRSSKVDVASGVPQGSVLGPFLFLIYINDLVDQLSGDVKMRLFADDCVVYVSYQNLQAQLAVNSLQSVLDKIGSWADRWLMEFNPGKSALLRFSRRRCCNPSIYRLGSASIPVEKKYKYLGVLITDALKWDKHVESITAKASQSLGFFKRNLKGCSIKVKKKVYETCVRPQVEYASVVWGPMKRVRAQKCMLEENLEKVQKRAARWALSDYDFRSSVSQMQERLGWDSLAKRRHIDRLCFIYKGVYNLYDLSSHISFRQPGDFRSVHNMHLHVLSTRLDTVQGSVFVRGAKEWNNLSANLISISDVSDFRHEVYAM